MEAGKTRNFADRTTRIAHAKALKFKAVYGSNASGKSSLVKAFDFMQTAVIDGIPSNSVADYCRLYEENSTRPSSFEVEVALNDTIFLYGFDVLLSESRFLTEWLYEKKGSKKRLIFTRDIASETFDIITFPNSSALNERLRIYADDIKSDGTILFLKSMNQNKDSLYTEDSKITVFRTLYRWFRYKLSVNYPDDSITQYTYFFDSQGSAAAEELLAKLDTGISKVSVYDEPTEKVMAQLPKPFAQSVIDNLNEQKQRRIKDGNDEPPAVVVRSYEGHSMYLIELHGDDVVCKTLKFNHKHSNALFTLRDESDGTIRLLDLIEVLLSNTRNMVYVIDEVNRCLHPLITKQFVRDFLDLAVQRNIQLIVTTHETSLMDLKLLRQDEIGFIEKRESDGSSRIFCLEDYGARFDKSIRNAYMKGQYDAVPRLESLG
jgi:AAA15 family ATPase/GTPase